MPYRLGVDIFSHYNIKKFIYNFIDSRYLQIDCSVILVLRLAEAENHAGK